MLKNRSLLARCATSVLIVVCAFANTTAWAFERPVDVQALRAQVRAHVYDHLRARPTVPRYVDGEVVYRLKGDTQRFRVQQVADTARALRDLRANPDVEYVEQNAIATIQTVPNDPYYPLQWNFDSPSTGGVGAEEAWDVGAGAGVTVAVIDTGVAYENYTSGTWLNTQKYYRAPDLAGTCFVPGYDYINNDTHPNDDNSHGTHVAGTIAQTTGNGVGVAGLAHQACIMPLKALDATGSGTHVAIANAIYYATDHGADVITMSLGSSVGTQTLLDAVAYAHGKGVTIVAAAGNDGGAVSYPAAYDEYVIAVGATRYDETLAGYSNRGASIDVVAPGGDLAVNQNGDGYADGVLQQTFNPSTKVRNEWGYYFFQGTSMSTPHVAAAAAIVLGQGTAVTPDEVRRALTETAQDLGAVGRDDTYGHGLIDVPSALAWTSGPVDTLPSVSIVEPGANVAVAESVEVIAVAEDDVSVESVQLSVAGATYPMVYDDTVQVYRYTWDSTQVGEGAQTLAVVATDSAGQVGSATVVVVVDNVNEAPIADAGADQAVEVAQGELAQVTLDGTASYDADPKDTLSYVWYVGEGDEPVSVVPSFNIALATGTHTYRLVVKDARGGIAEDTVTVTVTEQAVPSITLSLRGYKVSKRVRVDLTWGGASSANVDVYRNTTKVTTTANDGFYTDRTNLKSPVTLIYKVCVAGGVTVCSEPVSVTVK